MSELDFHVVESAVTGTDLFLEDRVSRNDQNTPAGFTPATKPTVGVDSKEWGVSIDQKDTCLRKVDQSLPPGFSIRRIDTVANHIGRLTSDLKTNPECPFTLSRFHFSRCNVESMS